MAALIAAGINVTGTVDYSSQASKIYIKGNGTAATVRFNSLYTIAVGNNAFYDEFNIDHSGFVVVTGAVDYVASD